MDVERAGHSPTQASSGLMAFNWGGCVTVLTASGACTKVLQYILGLLTGVYNCHGWCRDVAELSIVRGLKMCRNNFADGGSWLKS